jgi:ABC-type branched-subunit amino acid transport system substrate-binding protein
MGEAVRTKWTRIIGLLLLGAIVASGCGSDRKDDDRAGGTTSTTAPSTTGAKTFGTLESPCGEGDAKGATDAGVTDTDITIGYGDDAGFPSSPGLNHQMSDAITAMMKWCNGQGGINGREVKGTYYDAAITNVNNAMTQACSDNPFMMVGEGWALDAAQEQIRQGCKLPAFPTYSVSPEFANSPLMYAAVPNPVDYQPVTEANWYAKTYPEKAKKIGIMFANFAATADTKDKALSTWPKVGASFLSCQLEYNIVGESDYKPFIQKLKGCGAEAVYFVGSPYPIFENILEAADQLDFHPDWLLEANAYDEQLAKWNVNGFADRIFVRLQDVPFEYADKNKATQDYLDIVKANGGDVSDLGAHAASAFLLWATAAKSCGAELTRDCVLEYAAGVHDWDGGGMSGKADVGKNIPSPCEVVITLKGTEWEQIHPKTPGELDCDEANVQQVTGKVVDKVELGPDRLVHKFEVK